MAAIPGVLMRLAQPTENGSSASPTAPCPNIEYVYVAKANDGKTPYLNTLYLVSDIAPLLSSSKFYDEDVKAHASQQTISWVVCSFVNSRYDEKTKSAPDSTMRVLPIPPAIGSVIIINGSTPRPDKEYDYHDWYDQEHGQKLTLVPGWTSAIRYTLQKSYGDIETASFYGVNFYAAENGLGGPEWMASKTEWTMRIRSNAAKPNIRREWVIVSTGNA